MRRRAQHALQRGQLLRHETISGLLAYKEDLSLRNWLAQKFSYKSLLIIIWAAMGHHRKFDKSTQPKEALRLTVDTLHPDFKQILNEMSRLATQVKAMILFSFLLNYTL